MLRNGVVGVTISSLCALQAPALQRLGHDREGGPPFFGKEPARRGEEGPVGGAVAGPLASPGEHPQLMVEHGDLELPVIEARPNEQVKQPAREAIEKERQHEAQSERLQLPRQRRWSPARSNMCTPHASEVLAHLYAVRDAPTLDAARAAADRFANTFAREYPAAVACFTEDLDALLAIHRVPVRHRIRVRTTNLAERSFEEERRRRGDPASDERAGHDEARVRHDDPLRGAVVPGVGQRSGATPTEAASHRARPRSTADRRSRDATKEKTGAHSGMRPVRSFTGDVDLTA